MRADFFTALTAVAFVAAIVLGLSVKVDDPDGLTIAEQQFEEAMELERRDAVREEEAARLRAELKGTR